MAGISKAQLTMTGRASNADGVAHDGPLTIQVSLNLDASGCGGGGVDALAEPGGEQNLHAFIKQDHRVGRVAAHYVVEEVAHSYLHRGHPPVVAIAADVDLDMWQELGNVPFRGCDITVPVVGPLAAQLRDSSMSG